RAPKAVVSLLAAAEFGATREDDFVANTEEAAACELLVIEDVHHLRPQAFAALAAVLDERHASHGATVVTALAGPQELGVPARLASRLAGGLVVRLEPWQSASRLAVLLEKAQRRQLAVSREILAFVAEQLSGGARQLEGALTTLEGLARVHGAGLEVASVAA